MKIYHVTKDWDQRMKILQVLGLTPHVTVNGLTPFNHPSDEQMRKAREFEKQGLIELRNIP